MKPSNTCYVWSLLTADFPDSDIAVWYDKSLYLSRLDVIISKPVEIGNFDTICVNLMPVQIYVIFNICRSLMFLDTHQILILL